MTAWYRSLMWIALASSLAVSWVGRAAAPVRCTEQKLGTLRCSGEVIEGVMVDARSDGTFDRVAWYQYLDGLERWRRTTLHATGQARFAIEDRSPRESAWTLSHWIFPRRQRLTVSKYPGELRLEVVDAAGMVWTLAGTPMGPTQSSFVVERIGQARQPAIPPKRTEPGVMGVDLDLPGAMPFYMQHQLVDFRTHKTSQAPFSLTAKSIFHDRAGRRCEVPNREIFEPVPDLNDAANRLPVPDLGNALNRHLFKLDTDEKAIQFLSRRCPELDVEPLRRPSPPPPHPPSPEGPADLAQDVALITGSLTDPDPARRIAGCKLIRGKVRDHGAKQMSDALTPLLVQRLHDPDPEVRLWVALALQVLDGRSLPDLRAALERERDIRVANQLMALIRKFEPTLTAEQAEQARLAHPCQKRDRQEMMSWPIQELCDPIGHYPTPLFSLGDGTFIYPSGKSQRECFRGRLAARCLKKCLPGSARIATPDGPIRVDELREGSIVWTVDASGNRAAAPLLRVSSVGVGDRHTLIRVLLADGRAFEASRFHPLPGGAFIGDLAPGQVVDGSAVIQVREIDYAGRRTFDLLPGGPTGLYFADGVLLGSTLRR